MLNIYESLLVAFCYKNRACVLDLNTNKWYLSNAQLMSAPVSIMDGKDNYAYFLRCVPETANNFLFKVHWMDIFPKKLIKFYMKNKYHKLVHGFVRNFEKTNDLSYHFPVYLRKKVLSFYPCFLDF